MLHLNEAPLSSFFPPPARTPKAFRYTLEGVLINARRRRAWGGGGALQGRGIKFKDFWDKLAWDLNKSMALLYVSNPSYRSARGCFVFSLPPFSYPLSVHISLLGLIFANGGGGFLKFFFPAGVINYESCFGVIWYCNEASYQWIILKGQASIVLTMFLVNL